MQTHGLSAHPAYPPRLVRSVEARIGVTGDGWLALRWRVEDGGSLIVPEFAGRERADGLWRTTCFELFCRSSGCASYAEINLSPSERWAAYDFARYREEMQERPIVRHPVVTPRGGRNVLIFDAALRLADLPPLPWDLGLCAVIEEQGGVKSYWAMSHSADEPDFHDAACFAASLAPPQRP